MLTYQWKYQSAINMILGVIGPSSAAICAYIVFWPSQSDKEVLQINWQTPERNLIKAPILRRHQAALHWLCLSGQMTRQGLERLISTRCRAGI